MHERIPITATAPWAISSVDGSGPISHTDVAKEIWQALTRKAAGERDIPPVGLVVQGGGMRGVYSMAVLAAFEEMGWTRCFDHVAGASAGAMNGAHFITGQAGYGVETYIDYLSNRKFIDFFRLKKLVDLDYMIDDLVRHVRPFNLPALLDASTELHIALADAEDASVHYVTNRSENVDLQSVVSRRKSQRVPPAATPSGARMPLHRGHLDETAIVPESAGEPAPSRAGLVGDAPLHPGPEARRL
jgi:Patatin-like phospholipase